MRFFLKAYSSSEVMFDSIYGAVVDIDRELAKKILARFNIFREVKLTDKDLYELYFWDGQAQFLKDLYELYFLTEEELLELPEDIVFSEDKLARSECDQMIIREDRVAWVCIAKHTDVYYTTSEIPLDIIREVLDGKSET